ncbi:putative holin-like toxin [Gracilibacillus saliphilus]
MVAYSLFVFHFYRRGGALMMSVFETLTLMIAFAMLIIVLLSFHQKK